jgi:hypothetical protein
MNTSTDTSTMPPMPPTDPSKDPSTDQSTTTPVGGRRHKGSKKMHKGKRHGNASLRAWVTFVKKVQKEEGVSYKEAMSVAKKRKDSGEKWRGGDSETIIEDTVFLPERDRSESMEGGRRRRRSKKHRGSKKCGGSKKRRHSRRH